MYTITAHPNTIKLIRLHFESIGLSHTYLYPRCTSVFIASIPYKSKTYIQSLVRLSEMAHPLVKHYIGP